MDVKYFYLNNQMERDEYITIQISMIPHKFVERCNLAEKLHNGYIYARVTARNDTIELIFHKDKPKDRSATYVRAVCNIQPQKTDTHRTRLTAGGNLIDYPGEVSTPTSDLTTMKLHINSAISEFKSR